MFAFRRIPGSVWRWQVSKMVEIQKLEAKDYSVLADIADGFIPEPHSSIVLVAVDGKEIIGRIFLLAPVHIEGPWIREDKRNAFLGKQLIESVEEQAKNAGITKLFAYGIDQKTEDYLKRLGFGKLRMSVWSKAI